MLAQCFVTERVSPHLKKKEFCCEGAKSECRGYLSSIKVTPKCITTPMIRHPNLNSNGEWCFVTEQVSPHFLKKSFDVKLEKVSERG
jgi:hypothetical protein